MDQFNGSLEDVLGGSGRLVTLVGEPGAGKTPIWEDLVPDARAPIQADLGVEIEELLGTGATLALSAYEIAGDPELPGLTPTVPSFVVADVSGGGQFPQIVRLR
ncbi:MAG: hypothetical protein O3C10_10670 [Chloroflexi bacterium]|nr:hypothetical protein [Chloroflexota bacterium]